MFDKEKAEECHETFGTLRMKYDNKTGYYSLLIFLFNPYSIALCAAKVCLIFIYQILFVHFIYAKSFPLENMMYSVIPKATIIAEFIRTIIFIFLL